VLVFWDGWEATYKRTNYIHHACSLWCGHAVATVNRAVANGMQPSSFVVSRVIGNRYRFISDKDNDIG
jgi:hypothetical protein